VPFTAVRVESQLWPIGPKERVQDAWLHDRLKVKGKLQDVDWSEFIYRAPAEEAACFGCQMNRLPLDKIPNSREES
jgi:hypothetical protein